jgi:integrase
MGPRRQFVSLAELLAALPALVREVPSKALPGVVGALAAAQAEALARIVAGSSLTTAPGPAENLPVAEAARRLGVSRDWVYRNAPSLPFAVRIGRRLLFDARGMERWNRSRAGPMMLDSTPSASAPSPVVSYGDGKIYRRAGSSRFWITYSVRGRRYREPGGRTETEARKKLLRRVREAGTERFAGPAAERVTVEALADALLVHMKNQGRASADKVRSHLKPVRAFFLGRRALEVTTAAMERYQRERLDAKMAPATVNREVHALRRAFNVAAQQTPPLFPRYLVPYFPTLPVENVRTGFFDRAEVEALLACIEDEGIRDFIEWAFRTGMRKGEIRRLTWEMLDRTGSPWVLRVPGPITKNRSPRALGLLGATKVIMERRLLARCLDCPLIFHRVAKGKAGQPIADFWDVWKAGLNAAGLAPSRLFHDLRRSAVRTLIRAGVDQATAMKVSGHKTASMLLRYNIVTEQETANALLRADEYLLTQPRERNVERAQFGHSRAVGESKVRAGVEGIGSSGRIRTYDPPVNSRMLYR